MYVQIKAHILPSKMQIFGIFYSNGACDCELCVILILLEHDGVVGESAKNSLPCPQNPFMVLVVCKVLRRFW